MSKVDYEKMIKEQFQALEARRLDQRGVVDSNQKRWKVGVKLGSVALAASPFALGALGVVDTGQRGMMAPVVLGVVGFLVSGWPEFLDRVAFLAAGLIRKDVELSGFQKQKLKELRYHHPDLDRLSNQWEEQRPGNRLLASDLYALEKVAGKIDQYRELLDNSRMLEEVMKSTGIKSFADRIRLGQISQKDPAVAETRKPQL